MAMPGSWSDGGTYGESYLVVGAAGFGVVGPEGEGRLQGLDLVLEVLDVADFTGVFEDGADGAEARLQVGNLQIFAEREDGLEAEVLKAALGKVGALAL